MNLLAGVCQQLPGNERNLLAEEQHLLTTGLREVLKE